MSVPRFIPQIFILSFGMMMVLVSSEGFAVEAPNSPSPAAAPVAERSVSDDYEIVVGDKLSYQVVEDREPAKILSVSPTGDIEIPDYGRVTVAGKTLGQVRAETKAQLEKDLFFQATVRLSVESTAHVTAAQKPKQIFVVGAVRAPGPQEMPFGEKYMLSRAIIRAGGFTQFGDGKKVQVVRKSGNKSEKIIVDVIAVLKRGELDKDIEVQPDDMIIVPEKFFNVF